MFWKDKTPSENATRMVIIILLSILIWPIMGWIWGNDSDFYARIAATIVVILIMFVMIAGLINAR